MADKQSANSLFQSLWSDYIAFNPQAKRVYDLILANEKKQDSSIQELVNDHIALRTLNHPKIGIDVLGATFEKYGYKACGEYEFVEKKLFARHFEHSDSNMPKVFISELETQKLSRNVQAMAEGVINAIASEDVFKDAFLWSGRTWAAEYKKYIELLKESEYAAWVYAFGFRANHFTISLNHLKSLQTLPQLNQFIKSNGYELNQSGGEIKGTPEQLLEQSSTLAEKTQVEFTDGIFEIPACYYEFARRYPKADGKLYQGFIAASADKIFESTNVRR